MNTSPVVERIQERLLRLYSEQEVSEVWPLVQERLTPVMSGTEKPLWTEKDAILITYGDSVLGEGEYPLESLAKFVRTYLQDAVPIVHILPFCPYTSDDGFSISDYESVRPDLGDWSHVDALGQTHDLMFDLVLNHCSASHEWFQQFLKGEEPGKHFFHAPDPDTDVRDVVRPRTHPLLTPFDTAEGKKWVWTTFSSDQVDLNFSNPDVLVAFLDILLLYARQGARIIRLDAIAFLWKTLGTNCLHLPETHEVVKLMRDVLELAAPGVILLTETNVPHEENVSYFGEGDEARMVYQFPLPPLLLHALRRGDAGALNAWLQDLQAPPEGCTFFNFTASHDGIGVRPLEGLVPMDEVKQLAEEIRATGGKVNERSHPDGSTTPYELNATYFSALELPEDSTEDHLKRFLLSQTFPMCLQGIPAFYLHSFTATPNDLEGMARTGQNRSINRRRWQWEEVETRYSEAGHPARTVLEMLRERLILRAGQPEFHPDMPQQVLEVPNSCVAVKRGDLVAVHNMSNRTESLPLKVSDVVLQDAGVTVGDGELTLPPLSVCWFR